MLNKPQEFIGKEAIAKIKAVGVTKRLAQFHILNFDKDKALWPGGGEALYRDGEYVGCVTNFCYGFTLEKMICLGFIHHPDSFKDGVPRVLDNSWLLDRKAEWTINIAGTVVRFKICLAMDNSN